MLLRHIVIAFLLVLNCYPELRNLMAWDSGFNVDVR